MTSPVPQRPCPHCGRIGCRSCASRSVATQPLRDDPAYWSRGRHYPDHGGTGLYGNGYASEGPEDFGNQLWGLSVDRWMEEAEQSVGTAERLRVFQAHDAKRRMIEWLAVTPTAVKRLHLSILRGYFSVAERTRVLAIIRQALDCRDKLLQENSRLAAHLRATARQSR